METLGGNVANEGWRKTRSCLKRSKWCRHECCGARQQKWGKWKRRRQQQQQRQQQQRQQQQQRRFARGRRTGRQADLRALLRPVNVNGKRAPGMRAPSNTTQFLMHEKYQELKKQAAGCPSYWQEEGDSVLDYMSYFEHSWGGFEQASAESLQNGEHGQLSQSMSEQYSSSEKDVDRTETFLKRNFEDMYNRLEDNANSEV